MRPTLKSLFLLLLVTAVLLGVAGVWWIHQPMALRTSLAAPGTPRVLDLEIEPGTTANGVAAAVVASGADVPVLLLTLQSSSWFMTALLMVIMAFMFGGE